MYPNIYDKHKREKNKEEKEKLYPTKEQQVKKF